MTGLAKSLQVICARCNRADPVAWAGGRVEIAAGDSNQSNPISPVSEPAAFAGRKTGAIDLESVHTRFGERAKL
jgi:hypothetical protein